MSSDQVIRDAASRLRAGLPPGLLVGSLDPATLRALRVALPGEAFLCHKCGVGAAAYPPDSVEVARHGRRCCCLACHVRARDADATSGSHDACNDCPLRLSVPAEPDKAGLARIPEGA